MTRTDTLRGMLAACLLACISAVPAHAIDLKDLLGGKTGDAISNIIEGVFTKSDLSVEDLAGSWEATGAAVTFKSENFLQKAGGLAGAAAIESQLNPYYQKYGLTGATLLIARDGTFTMKIKKMQLKGVVEKGKEEGTFDFKFQAFNRINIGTFTAYVEKSPKNLNVMFDATKMKSLVSTIATLTGQSLAKAAAGILDSYDGACMGFKMRSIGEAPLTKEEEKAARTQQADTAKSATGLLRQILTSGSKKK